MGTDFDVSCAAIKKKNGWSASKWMGIWAHRFLRTQPAKFKIHNSCFSVHLTIIILMMIKQSVKKKCVLNECAEGEKRMSE